MSRQPSEEVFLKDVAKHQMAVLHEDGLYRHLLFREPGNGNHWFELVTWPGALTINGDMGAWSFSRIEDMFNFFRSSKGLRINPHYWAEKLLNGVSGGWKQAKVFDADLFKKELLEHLENCGLDDYEFTEVKEQLETDVFGYDEQHVMVNAAYEFCCDLASGKKFSLECEDIPDGEDWSYHYIWCLYAIVWGIQQWDSRKGVAIDAA